MLSTLLFAIGVALALFFLSNFLFNRYIEREYLSDEKREQRATAYKEDLQKFVTEHALSCEDTKEISKWAQGYKYLYVLIYKDDKLLFESGRYEEEKEPEMGENKENEDNKPDDSVENGSENTDGETDKETGDDTDKDTGTDNDTETDPDKDTEAEPADPSVDNGTDTDGKDDSQGGTETEGDGSSADGEENTEGNTSSGGTTAPPKGDSTEQTKPDDRYPSSGITVRTPTRDELIAEAVAGGSYPIVASDGVLLASMVDYTEYLYYDIFNIISMFIAVIAFILVMWFYFFEITKRITRLGREVTAIADGDMGRSITAEGEDEITRLCTDVEYMRSSMLENIEKERAALEANRELITAMSHDIRTPLTVLLGYLDIMKLNSPEGDMQQYIDASERTALRLKKMSDDMFNYFLVYGGGIEVSIQECDAGTLIDQMLTGHVFLLREQGYTIDFNFESEDNSFLSNTIVVTDPPQLMRIVENIFSNVMKYADKEKTVTVYVGRNTDEMQIKVSNYIRSNPDEAQKNGIGMRSCMKLANAMDIIFASREIDGVYVTEMSVPIIPDIEYGEGESENERGGFIGWLRSVFEKLKKFAGQLLYKPKQFFTRIYRAIKSFVILIITGIKKGCKAMKARISNSRSKKQ